MSHVPNEEANKFVRNSRTLIFSCLFKLHHFVIIISYFCPPARNPHTQRADLGFYVLEFGAFAVRAGPDERASSKYSRCVQQQITLEFLLHLVHLFALQHCSIRARTLLL